MSETKNCDLIVTVQIFVSRLHFRVYPLNAKTILTMNKGSRESLLSRLNSTKKPLHCLDLKSSLYSKVQKILQSTHSSFKFFNWWCRKITYPSQIYCNYCAVQCDQKWARPRIVILSLLFIYFSAVYCLYRLFSSTSLHVLIRATFLSVFAANSRGKMAN